jgi:PadR family transcriptional regulator PadR
MPKSLSLLQGTVDVLILRAIAFHPTHGYGVSEWLRSRTNGTIDIEDAALYKALHRLEKDGAIEAEWGVSENNRKARYYRLTTAGRRLLRVEEAQWREYAAAMSRVLETAS